MVAGFQPGTLHGCVLCVETEQRARYVRDHKDTVLVRGPGKVGAFAGGVALVVAWTIEPTLEATSGREQDRVPHEVPLVADEKIERVLTTDPGLGVVRHADAGYPEALAAAERLGVRIPMR